MTKVNNLNNDTIKISRTQIPQAKIFKNIIGLCEFFLLYKISECLNQVSFICLSLVILITENIIDATCNAYQLNQLKCGSEVCLKMQKRIIQFIKLSITLKI